MSREQREPEVIAVARAHVARCSHQTSERLIDGSCVFQQDNDTYYRVGGLLAAYDDLHAQLAAAEEAKRCRESAWRTQCHTINELEAQFTAARLAYGKKVRHLEDCLRGRKGQYAEELATLRTRAERAEAKNEAEKAVIEAAVAQEKAHREWVLCRCVLFRCDCFDVYVEKCEWTNEAVRSLRKILKESSGSSDPRALDASEGGA